jgi:hypothetical protein
MRAFGGRGIGSKQEWGLLRDHESVSGTLSGLSHGFGGANH